MSSDYFSFDELSKLNEQIQEFKKAYVRIMRFCFNFKLFMLDNGSLFYYLVSEFRRHAVMPTKWKGPGEVAQQQPQEVLVLNGKLSSWAPVVVIGITILSLTFLTIYKYLTAQAAILGIVAVFLIAFSPQIIIRILSALGREPSEDEEKINYEEIFGEIIERYKQSIMHVRVNLRTPDESDKKSKKADPDPLTELQKLDLWEVENPDKETKKVQAESLPDPYGDVLEGDEVAQSQVFFSAWVANKLGTIYNSSEKELYRRKRFILEKSAEAASGQSSQSLKARVS